MLLSLFCLWLGFVIGHILWAAAVTKDFEVIKERIWYQTIFAFGVWVAL